LLMNQRRNEAGSKQRLVLSSAAETRRPFARGDQQRSVVRLKDPQVLPESGEGWPLTLRAMTCREQAQQSEVRGRDAHYRAPPAVHAYSATPPPTEIPPVKRSQGILRRPPVHQ
jgi:hypothetical protein